MSIILRTLPFFILALFPFSALAHSSAEDSNGFLTGLMHPVLGLDHLLAMISVGIISAQMGGRAIWSVPASFVGVMLIGGLIGMNAIDWFGFDIAMTLVEQGIILSVMILGLVIAIDRKMPELAAMGCVAFFAFFHGYAHGSEFPDFEFQWFYTLGFIAGTSGLHIVGVFIGFAADQLKHGRILLRHAGSIIVGIGLHMAIEHIEYVLYWQE